MARSIRNNRDEHFQSLNRAVFYSRLSKLSWFVWFISFEILTGHNTPAQLIESKERANKQKIAKSLTKSRQARIEFCL
jgi:c-di-GMP-related signal transduction protein